MDMPERKLVPGLLLTTLALSLGGGRVVPTRQVADGRKAASVIVLFASLMSGVR
jgi:hypothetical protein